MADTCAICKADRDLAQVVLAPREEVVLLCDTCQNGLKPGVEDAAHWQSLHEAIWDTDPTTQVAAYRILSNLQSSPWVRDLMEIAYLEPEVLDWAKSGLKIEPELVHRDSNGTVLSAGDTVTLIKDLNVKGAGFTAKRGTAVRNISLSQDKEMLIEGRVEGQKIVILTQFVKKS